MKKTASLLICVLIIMTSTCVFASAVPESNVYYYNIDGIEITVEIGDPTIAPEKQEAIANALVGKNEYGVAPANIWCDIFGHDFLYTTSTSFQHKVSADAPRCKELTYDVTYCEDCDYQVHTLKSTTYIFCCPEE